MTNSCVNFRGVGKSHLHFATVSSIRNPAPCRLTAQARPSPRRAIYRRRLCCFFLPRFPAFTLLSSLPRSSWRCHPLRLLLIPGFVCGFIYFGPFTRSPCRTSSSVWRRCPKYFNFRAFLSLS